MTTIQVAILFPAVLIWLALIVQYGLWWHAKQVANAAAAGISVIVVEARGTLLMDRPDLERAATAHGISIVGVRHG